MSAALAFSRHDLAQRAREELERRERDSEIKYACEGSLHTFLRHAWPHFESNDFVSGWHIEAICEHLEALSLGYIDKLLINVPPRSSKTDICLVAWPCWTWARPFDRRFIRMGPQVRFLCASYGARKAQQDGVTARRLIGTRWFQNWWGNRVQIAPDRDNAEQFDTLAGGSRINTGIPESLGKGGLIRCLDDPNKTDEVEGSPVLESVLRAYDEVWSTRSNDSALGAEMLIMQRLDERDLTGHVREKGGWTHLMIPNQYDAERHCRTWLGPMNERYPWDDPRGCDDDGNLLPKAERETRNGVPFWPERNRATKYEDGQLVPLADQGWEWCRQKARDVGSHAYACQFQQSPIARGGNVIQADWWRLWEGDYPKLGTVMVSYDSATGLKAMNSYRACTVWGAFAGKGGRPCLLLLDAWRMRSTFNEAIERLIATCQDLRRLRPGVVEDVDDDHPSPLTAIKEWHPNHVGHMLVQGVTRRPRPGQGEFAVPRWEADTLLIEDKSDGRPVAQEIQRIMGPRRWNTVLVDPGTSDKYARLQQTQYLFEKGIIYAPDTSWAQMVIDEVSSFPKGKSDDLTDTVSMAINYLRRVGVALTREEHDAIEEDELQYRPELEALYDV